MVFPLFKVWNSLQQWEDVEVTIHENDVVFYNSEMCINSGKMMEMTYKGYPTNNSIVIRTSQSELPDLFCDVFCYLCWLRQLQMLTQSCYLVPIVNIPFWDWLHNWYIPGSHVCPYKFFLWQNSLSCVTRKRLVLSTWI